MDDVSRFSMKLETQVPLPRNWGLHGPVLAVLSAFMHDTYRPKEVLTAPKVYRAMRSLGIPQEPKNDDLPEELLQQVTSHSETVNEDPGVVSKLASQIFRTGRTNLPILPCFSDSPDVSEDGNFIRKRTCLRRLHLLFFDGQKGGFVPPAVDDPDYGYLFYQPIENQPWVDLKEATAKKGKFFSQFLHWRLRMRRDLLALSHQKNLFCGHVELGEPYYRARPASQIQPSYVESLILMRERDEAMHSDRPIPCSIDDLKNEDEEAFEQRFKRIYSWITQTGAPVPANQFIRHMGEPTAYFEANSRFQPVTIIDPEHVNPPMTLFDVPAEAKREDAVVFNGVDLPWY